MGGHSERTQYAIARLVAGEEYPTCGVLPFDGEYSERLHHSAR